MNHSEYASNSQLIRQLLQEIANDTSVIKTQQRDHEFVLAELSRRLRSRYALTLTGFNLRPRDSTHITIDAVGVGGVCGSTMTTHFANTAFISKRKHYASWGVTTQSA